MEILKPNQLKEKFNDPWIAPYQKVLTMVDGNKVEIVEFHPCISGSHWLLHQYKNNSDLNHLVLQFIHEYNGIIMKNKNQ